MILVDAQISQVCQALRFFFEDELAPLEDCEVVLASSTKACRKDASRISLDNDLRLQRVTTLFAAVVRFLVFFGRWIGLSVASTMITSKTMSLA